MFLGGGEVAPLHLAHGLTRVEGAAQALERLGVDVAGLRRATAAAIAGEAAAVSGPAPSAALRTAPELTRLLHRAAALAGAPASPRDVLRALLAAGPGDIAAALVLEAAANPDALRRWSAEVPANVPDFIPQTAAVERLTARLSELEAAVRMLQDELGRAVAGLAQRFEAIRAFAPGEGSDLAARLAQLEAAVAAQPSRFADAVAFTLAQRAGAEGDPQAANGADRLAHLEEMLRIQSERREEANRAHEREFHEAFGALVKLGANQQTLAGNLEAWRLDSSGDIGIVGNRLAALEGALRAVLPRPRPQPPAGIAAPPPGPGITAGGETAPAGSLRRWLVTTGRMLPPSWREDMNALRETLRLRRRNAM
jgi:hypothetical protein